MVLVQSPKNNRRDETVTSALIRYILKYRELGTVFVVGVLVGMILDKTNNYDKFDDFATVQERHLQTIEISRSGNSNKRNNNNDGWNKIDVFYGATEHFESLVTNQTALDDSSDGPQRFHSQARQDEVVLALLRNKTNGYFVDLAANDAIVLSNSYALEKHYRWTGLCIEPNPMYWYNLTHTRKGCQLVGAVVGSHRMDTVNFLFKNVYGGIVGEGFDNGNRWRSHAQRAYTVSLEEIFRRFDAPRVIDYLSLDVEGAEELVMEGFPFGEYTVRILTIERPTVGLRALLEGHGYRQILRLSRWGETLWVHADAEDDLDTTNLEEFSGKNQYRAQKAREQLQEQQQQTQ